MSNVDAGMIYLFCNRTYGAPFLEAAARYRRRTGAPITAVISSIGVRRDRLPVVRRWLEALGPRGLPELCIDDVNALSFLNRLRPGDAGIIAGFNQIFRPLSIERLAPFVNFHASLLPYYRGPVPVHWCIANGERATGFTLHAVTPRIDDGEILYQELVLIDGITDPTILARKIATQGARVMERWLDHLHTGAAWQPVRLDAGAVYEHKVGYATFPPRAADRS